MYFGPMCRGHFGRPRDQGLHPLEQKYSCRIPVEAPGFSPVKRRIMFWASALGLNAGPEGPLFRYHIRRAVARRFHTSLEHINSVFALASVSRKACLNGAFSAARKVLPFLSGEKLSIFSPLLRTGFKKIRPIRPNRTPGWRDSGYSASPRNDKLLSAANFCHWPLGRKKSVQTVQTVHRGDGTAVTLVLP